MTNSDLKPSRDIAVLLEVMKCLRDGCPWDMVQTFETIAPYTIEEAYEVASAIAVKDMKALPGELGDLLFQVVFHARMAEEAGLFDFGAVVEAVTSKMIRRHPHVFGDEKAKAGAASQKDFWEKLKESERTAAGHTSLLDDVAGALPALMRAEKLQRRASSVGFDWNDPQRVLGKIAEEAREVLDAETDDEREDEIGDLLFVVANMARHLKVDPEVALRRSNAKFTRRFRHIETTLGARGIKLCDASLDEMEALWQEAKRAEKSAKKAED
ncbi:MAG: nucleoside triphosphate pyrophosphohydrolase [Alphaproteobacteria bacterium]|nr:nucleoside triphosphate pyrophosphohydrolase [Alphaproteobacteria bacterium]